MRRPVEFWSAAVHDLLRFLEEASFPASRLVRTDHAEEVLTWIEGESGASGWRKIVDESGLARWAGFLRRYHETVAWFRPRSDSVWSSGAAGCGGGEVVCHGDFGPWNGVWRGQEIVGLIDFDHARPARPSFDVAYALEYAAPFRDDEECVRWLGYPEPPDRRRRIRLFCDAYGIAVPPDIVDRVAEVQRRVGETRDSLASRGIEPQAGWVRDGVVESTESRIAWTRSFQW